MPRVPSIFLYALCYRIFLMLTPLILIRQIAARKRADVDNLVLFRLSDLSNAIALLLCLFSIIENLLCIYRIVRVIALLLSDRFAEEREVF